ncbi:MAG: ParB N-terminal domain-containing protein [Pseudomonadota bacterium]
MAKRKRLTVPTAPSAGSPSQAPTETQMTPPPDATPALQPDLGRRAPIADVAGEASALNALERVTRELAAAKHEGRMVQPLPLDAIQTNYLVRDRVTLDTEEMDTLKTSLAARGQQTPIEVVPTGNDVYGLISGYRRLQALKELSEADPDAPRTVLALIRHPDDASDAYTAMVEENEIRVGLSYFERASIVQAAVREGVFPTETAALQGLFAAASRSKRSKIKSFLPVVTHLGAALAYPTHLTERLGLALAARCDADPAFADRLKDRLRKAQVNSPNDEIALVSKALDGGDMTPGSAPVSQAPRPDGSAARPWSAQPHPDLDMSLSGGRLVLTGPAVTETFAAQLAHMLKKEDGSKT